MRSQDVLPDLTLIVAGDPGQRTGGYVYDARMVVELRRQGWRVTVLGLEGRFPLADQMARQSLTQALSTLPDNARVVIDGLAMGNLPDEVECHAERLQIIALVHHPLADETGLDVARQRVLRDSETRALAAARRVVVTSHYTARALRDYHVPVERIRVAEPGVDKAALASGALDHEASSLPWRLLCVATLTPRKGLGLLVEALTGLTDRPWVCEIVGSYERDTGYAATLMAEARRLGLAERVSFVGERNDEDLAAAYRQADLFVFPSLYEGYGMVVTEALSRGLPVITTTGGALVDTLPREAGIAVPPGKADALREALSYWMDDAGVRHRLRCGALRAREELADWQQAGKRFAAALDALPEAPAGTAACPERGVSS